MKNKFILPILLLTGILYLGSCGGSVTEDEIAEVEVREINKELDQLITNLAACEQQNTNCPAYTEASEGIEKLCSDEAARKEIVADLFYIIQTGPSARSQAGAHAVNFWTGSSDYKNDASYGRIVLEALKKESYDTDSYTGSQLGQLLSQWLVTSDKDLLADIVSAMKDKSVEMRGRSELIRLSSAESFAKIGVFDAVVAIVNNTKEEESIREQGLGILWRANDPGQVKTVKMLYESYLTNPNIKIAGPSCVGLGYMKSNESYDAIVAAILANKGDKYWYYYGSSALSNLIQSGKDVLDMNAVFTLCKEMLSNKEVEAYYRSNYLSTLAKIDTAASKALLNQLKNSREKEIAAEAKRVAK